jgi:hypothetical protein
MYIECIKGFYKDGFGIIQGEIFKLIDVDAMKFEGVEGANRRPGIEVDFTDFALVTYFKVTLTKIVV